MRRFSAENSSGDPDLFRYGFGPGDNPAFPNMHHASALVAGGTLELAATGLDLGILLLRRDQPGDAERATELLRTTADLASAIGMVPAVERARALIALD